MNFEESRGLVAHLTEYGGEKRDIKSVRWKLAVSTTAMNEIDVLDFPLDQMLSEYREHSRLNVQCSNMP